MILSCMCRTISCPGRNDSPVLGGVTLTVKSPLVGNSWWPENGNPNKPNSRFNYSCPLFQQGELKWAKVTASTWTKANTWALPQILKATIQLKNIVATFKFLIWPWGVIMAMRMSLSTGLNVFPWSRCGYEINPMWWVCFSATSAYFQCSQGISEPPESLRLVYIMTHAHWFARGLHCGVPLHEPWKKNATATHTDTRLQCGRTTLTFSTHQINLKSWEAECVIVWPWDPEHVKQDGLPQLQFKGDGYSPPAISMMQVYAVFSQREWRF